MAQVFDWSNLGEWTNWRTLTPKPSQKPVFATRLKFSVLDHVYSENDGGNLLTSLVEFTINALIISYKSYPRLVMELYSVFLSPSLSLSLSTCSCTEEFSTSSFKFSKLDVLQEFFIFTISETVKMIAFAKFHRIFIIISDCLFRSYELLKFIFADGKTSRVIKIWLLSTNLKFHFYSSR